MPIVVDPPREEWAALGLTLAARIRHDLGPVAVRVEHIGSTSIPGMPAKPVIDLQLSVTDLDAPVAGPLEALGLSLRPWVRDHVPAGLTDDPARWAKRMWSGPGVNLHVRLAGSPNERLALLFRDWFRAHPAAVPAYGAFKSALAGVLDDVGEYSDVKDPVVDLVIVVAQEWAAATGWSVSPQE
ncbi:GrpB family protein [Dactylosporangium sp. NBC_01737]|uniref:GrpB family protein n=1 Tax=Dactylosporangium sp. NBC_01737 TaxID=2975959 RepID=UPI002E0E351A|nr:GrpB family protein [Dactylosporangium sp. NBC_01737]